MLIYFNYSIKAILIVTERFKIEEITLTAPSTLNYEVMLIQLKPFTSHKKRTSSNIQIIWAAPKEQTPW